MGLDIIVFTDLQKVTQDYPYRFKLYNLPDFEDRCTAFDGFYTGACIYDFSLSYYTHTRYREELARLAGYEAEEAWNDPDKFKSKCFFKQINFSDFEGCIDYNTAELLFQQYMRHSFGAMLEMDCYHYELYGSFMEAFRLASETKGVVLYN